MKKALLISCVLLLMTLTGCSSENGITKWIEDQAIKNSGINPEEDAQKIIDEQQAVPAYAAISESGSIHVTFADNNFLSVEYSKSEDFSEGSPDLINKSCSLNNGDKIYAKVNVNNNTVSNLYSFSEFKIYSINDNSEFTQIDSSCVADGQIWQIPVDFNSTEISIIPVGKYQKREIKLNSYRIDDDGKEQNITGESGTWVINDEEYYTVESPIGINPVGTYTVHYKYDDDEYFVVQTNPDYYSNQNGEVVFKDKESTDMKSDNGDEYSVELHQYIDISVYSEQKRTVTVKSINNEAVSQTDKIKKTDKWEPTGLKLKYNDYIEIETDSKWDALDGNKKFKVSGVEEIGDKFLYTLQIIEGNGEFVFNPNDYSDEHGKFIFKLKGSEQIITDKCYLAAGRDIECIGVDIETGYWLPETVITVGDTDETKQKLEDLKFYQDKNSKVELPQPKYGGEIVYYYNGKKITGSVAEAKYGSSITMEFKLWNGWILNNNGFDTYTVLEKDSQTLSINDSDVSLIFSEHDSHKPELTINLDKSVKNYNFDVTIDTDTRNGLNYSDNKKTVIKQISTLNGIKIKSNSPELYGKAIKITAKMKTDGKDEFTEICYIDDPQSPALIQIYDYSKVVSKTYKSISITISQVDVDVYEPENIANGYIKLFYADTTNPTELKKGDIIDSSREILFKIYPNTGYYVSGSDVKNDIYQDNMDYSKYLKKIKSIIELHPIKNHIQ